jgi:hypothetical protein
MVLNDIPLEVDIKRSIMHKCLFDTDAKDDISYLVYELVEDPDDNIWIINLLRKPELIKDSGLDFEDIGMKQREVNKENFIEYVKCKTDYDNIPKGVKYVAEGINKRTGVGRVLLRKGVNVYVMNEILCNRRMSKGDVEGFINNQIEFDKVPDDVKEWFKRILLESDIGFVKRLIYFWGSTYNPIKNKKYQVVIGERIISRGVCPLPESHTCYTQLVLPQGIKNKSKLKEILEKAIGYVAKGMLMYGGWRGVKK